MDRLTIERLCYRLSQVEALKWGQALPAAAEEFGITTPERQAMWLANLCHESEGLTRLVEDMTYSAKRLAQVWPSRYAVNPNSIDRQPNAKALELDRRPDAIANDVYANRMGNGPPESGDGWRFRGHYPPQLTGRDNYTQCWIAIGIPDLEDTDALLDDVPAMARVSGWFWSRNNLNAMADNGDFRGVSQVWNMGHTGTRDPIGWIDRVTWHKRVLEALGVV